MAEAPQRYCTNCGHELSPGDQFCPNCGTPVHRAARVPTPEADVPVPPPQQQQQVREAGARSKTRGPKWALAGVFFGQAVLSAVQAASAASPNSNEALVLAVAAAVGSLVGFALIVGLVGGLAYLLFFIRREGATFQEAFFNWPMVAVAGVVALLRFLG
jgi:hypothetical protein